MNFENWKETVGTESEFNDDNIEIRSKNLPSTFSREISTTFGYMIGVDELRLQQNIEGCGDYEQIKEILNKNEYATAIRHLNRIRSTIMLNFAYISNRTRITASDYCPIYQLEELAEDFNKLFSMEIDFTTGRNDLNEYLRIINQEIEKRIDKTKSLYPEWVNFQNILNAFIMPKDIERESKKFSANRNYYPYQKYFYWRKPYNCGNIVLSDNKLLYVIYQNNFEHFIEQDKVTDISSAVKNGIDDFIDSGTLVQVFVDGENTNPFSFYSAMQSLSSEQADKIDRIVIYYDSIHSTKAWTMLPHFITDIEIELVPVNRLKDNKSLVDHKLVAGVSKAVYQDSVDSIMLCSSDSDFWAIIEDVDARYLVMAESDKLGHDFKSALKEHSVLYCLLDKFRTPADNPYKKFILKNAYQDKILQVLGKSGINLRTIFEEVLYETYLHLSEQEIKNSFNEIMNDLSFSVDAGGNLIVEM